MSFGGWAVPTASASCCLAIGTPREPAAARANSKSSHSQLLPSHRHGNTPESQPRRPPNRILASRKRSASSGSLSTRHVNLAEAYGGAIVPYEIHRTSVYARHFPLLCPWHV